MSGPGLVNREGDREELQGLFLWLVADETPEVVEDLAATGRDDLRAWATRWRINAPWVLDHGALVLRDLVRWPKGEPIELWRSTGQGPGWIPSVPEFRAYWDPFLPSENRDDWRVTGRRAEARARLHNLLERYLDNVEALAIGAGFEPVARRDGGGNSSISEKLRWIVWRCCRTETRERWADGGPPGWALVHKWAEKRAGHSLDLDGMKKAARDLARLIELDLPTRNLG